MKTAITWSTGRHGEYIGLLARHDIRLSLVDVGYVLLIVGVPREGVPRSVLPHRAHIRELVVCAVGCLGMRGDPSQYEPLLHFLHMSGNNTTGQSNF